jgi:multiple sugar transport system substrate-binding protein
MRSRLAVIFSLLLFLTFAACSRVSTPAGDKATSTVTPLSETVIAVDAVTPTVFLDPVGVQPDDLKGVTVKLWHAWPSPQREILEAQIADFNLNNPWGIVVRAKPFIDYAALNEAVSVSLAEGNPPQLVAALPEDILTWDASASVVDLSTYITHKKWGMTAGEIDDIPAVVWAQDQIGERRLGLPAERSARLLYYNRTWAGDLGFDTPPKTADEFREQACAANASFKSDKLYSNDGYGGWIVDSDRQTILAWIEAFDGGVVTDGKYTFEAAPNLEALSYIKSLLDDNCAWVYAGQDLPQQFVKRDALFISGDLSEINYQQQLFDIAKSTDKWSLIGFPGTDESKIIVYGPSFAVLKTTPEQQLAAWLFARSMLKPEIQARWVKATGLLPLSKSSLDLLKDYKNNHPLWAAAVKLMDSAGIEPQLASWHTVKYVLDDGTNSIFRLGIPAQDIPDVLAQMQKTALNLSK